MPKERIQKLLAAAGFGSRRACELLVEKGRVTVNGQRVRELPCLVDPQTDRIHIDRKLVRPEKRVYFLLNKPRGILCTNTDPAGRKRAVDLMTGVRERVFPVGRLDADSMGLLIMTNDGELAQKLTHPSFQTPKTYRAELKGSPTWQTLEKLRQGIWLSEGRTAPATIVVVHKDREKAILEITLREGRNREIRRMLAKLGYRIRRLSRIRIGRLSIRKLSLGAYRVLTPSEVKYLYKLAEGAADQPKGRPTRTTRHAGPTGRAGDTRGIRGKTRRRTSGQPGTATARKTASKKPSPAEASPKRTSPKPASTPRAGATKRRRIVLPKD